MFLSTTYVPLLPKPPAPQPEFFVDRSLGRHIVADAIRALGYVVHAMADVYPDGEDQRVADTRWIADTDRRGWVVLTKDERITRRHYAHLSKSYVAETVRSAVTGLGIVGTSNVVRLEAAS